MLHELVPGLGDMAVSNTIGSNVFDILVGLGVPWAIQTICVSYGSAVSQIYALYLSAVFNTKMTEFWSLVSGCHQQSGAGVLGGSSPGLRGAHGENRIVELQQRK